LGIDLNAHFVSFNLGPAERRLNSTYRNSSDDFPMEDQVIRSAGKITGNKLGRNGDTIKKLLQNSKL
jgi:hypothetical protein